MVSMKKCILALIPFLLFACTPASKDEIKNLKFVEKGDVKMSNLVRDYSLIRLETQENNLIADATMVHVWNNRIFILDTYSTNKGVYVFGMEGEYIGRIGGVGQGPGEYIFPVSMSIDKEGNKLIVKDGAKNRLLFYSLSDYTCLEEINIPFYSNCVEYLAPNRLIWYVGSGCANVGEDTKHIQITDMKATPISRHMNRENLPKRGLYNVSTYFHGINDEMYFHHPFSNEMYCYDIETDSVRMRYILQWDGLTFPSKEYVVRNSEDIVNQLKQDGYISFYDIHENSERLLCYFGAGKDKYIGVYSKKQREGFYTNIEDIEDDLGLLKYVRPKSIYNDSFVSVVYTEELDKLKENSILYPLLKEVDSDGGNPIVVIYK